MICIFSVQSKCQRSLLLILHSVCLFVCSSLSSSSLLSLLLLLFQHPHEHEACEGNVLACFWNGLKVLVWNAQFHQFVVYVESNELRKYIISATSIRDHNFCKPSSIIGWTKNSHLHSFHVQKHTFYVHEQNPFVNIVNMYKQTADRNVFCVPRWNHHSCEM